MLYNNSGEVKMLIAAIKNIVKIFDNTIYDTFIKAAEKCGLDCVLLENTKELLKS